MLITILKYIPIVYSILAQLFAQNIHNCNMKSNILTIEQERFVLFLKLQKIPTYRIINYLTLLRNSEHLQEIWN